ncbi:hypothetical protein CANMA_001110 [Candida margitis]|uniref:uncharacterized protein n=1 Tax=Candida margitis TaxID=1775924 RepID=UPI0022272D4C|nr:uncharacterized protein CANMA_001110 [Candida margitis]KAI5969820.1 hypothetical protein CANMA_001110 [Candida margitis]
MSEFAKFKKADLSQVLKKLGVRTTAKDVKKVLVEKLDAYLGQHPKDVSQVRKILEETGANEGDEEEITVVEIGENDDDDDSDDDDDDDDSEEGSEDDDAEEEEEEEILEAALVEESEEDDKDYQAPPPLNLKEFVLDPIIATSENAIDKFYEFTDCVGITYLEHTEKLRDQLSSTITLNFLELILEFAVFLYNFTTVVPLNENKLIHQFFHDNIPFLATSKLPSIEFIQLFDFKAVATFATWIVFAIVSPSIIAYFVNFTSRVIEIDDDEYLLRIYSFDPFIFAVAKILIYYFVGQSSLIQFATADCWVSALKNRLLLHLGLYHTFAATLGTLPYVLGGVNVLIALYSQFEEY